MVRASTFHFINKHYWLKGKKIFYLVFIEMQMYGPRRGSRTLPWAKCRIFLEALLICNISRYFYFFKFLREVVWKISKTKKSPRQGTFPYFYQIHVIFKCIRKNYFHFFKCYNFLENKVRQFRRHANSTAFSPT